MTAKSPEPRERPAFLARKVSPKRVALGVLLAAGAGWAWLAWWRWVALEAPDYTAMGRFSPHWGLWALGLALAYWLGDGLLANAADGRIAWRWAPRWTLAVLLGWAGQCFASAVLLAAGTYSATRFHAIVAMAALIGSLLAGRPPRWPDIGARAFARRVKRSRHPLFSASMTAATALVLASYFAEAQLPPTQHDALTYHLALPRLYARSGSFEAFPHYVAKMPHYPQLLMMPGAALENSYSKAGAFIDHVERLDHVGAQTNTAFATLIVTILLFRFGTRLGGTATGALAAGLFAMDRAVEFQAPSGYVEIWGAAYVLAGLALLLERRSAARRAGWPSGDLPGLWALFYVCVGMLFGIKYTYAPCLLPAWLLAVGLEPRLKLQSLKRPAMLAGPLAFFAMAAPWAVKSWRETGVPLFPFGLERSKLDPLAIENARQVTEWLFGLARTGDPLAFFRVPLELAFNTSHPYEQFSINELSPGPLWILPLMALALLGRWKGPRGWLFATLLGTYAMWFLAVREGRFLMPIYPALFLLTASGATLCLRLAGPKWRPWLAAAMIAFFGFYHYYFVLDRSARLGYHLQCALTWRHPITADARGKAPAFDLFKKLNRDPRRRFRPIGMLMDNRTYYLDFPLAFQDSSLEYPFWAVLLKDSPAFPEASRRFREQGAELLFINELSLDYFYNTRDDDFRRSADYLRAYMKSPSFELLVREGGFAVGRPVANPQR